MRKRKKIHYTGRKKLKPENNKKKNYTYALYLINK
jgi:hypothetical protein